MHRAWLIEEVTCAIVGELTPTLVTNMDEDLAALAHTCRTLSKPTLDGLWHGTILYNLAQHMSADLWKASPLPERPLFRMIMGCAAPRASVSRR
jgi:hypothetical protein